ncbi:hypothetical protein [Hymenobacter swuensis]|uniref:Lipoprotein n=1 Tax=Hymenobacter swuensis DY53 TaxID=1227739 RepID=W8F5C1_9BACT|nr:hypothetical protein [Hymenobacter swuensis]AHJ96915.1 hypothetical protein Hsw_1320 [Hymenobacter swuensis DY53]
MTKLLPLSLLLLCGCEQEITPSQTISQTSAANSTVARTTSTDSYMRGYAQYEQCLWGQGACGVASTPDMTERTGGPSLRTPRVRLTLRQQRLDVQFLTPFDPEVKVLTIRPTEEFFVAQPETDALGAHAIKIKRGAYPIDTRMGEYGGVHFNVQIF